MNLDSAFEHDRLELLVDVVKHLTVYFKRFKHLLVRVLEGETGHVRRDLAPAGVCAPAVRRPEKDDELCPSADSLRSMKGLRHV
jgi:hypothetical protein